MKKLLPSLAVAVALLLPPGRAVAAIINVDSDGTWRATSPAPAAGWNTSLTFDDSDVAGWEYAFKSPQGAKIWIRSNQSSEAPNQAWFRKIFTLPAKPISASAVFIFDDDGEAYLNGTLIVADPGGGATTFNLQLDTNLFVAGENLIAVHGIDTHGAPVSPPMRPASSWGPPRHATCTPPTPRASPENQVIARSTIPSPAAWATAERVVVPRFRPTLTQPTT